MTINDALRLIAGCFVLASILLAHFHHPAWLFVTGFVALNLIQSAFSRWWPMMALLRKAAYREA